MVTVRLGAQRHFLIVGTKFKKLQVQVNKNSPTQLQFNCKLSGPLWLRVQSLPRTRSRIAASIAFLFCACLKGFRH